MELTIPDNYKNLIETRNKLKRMWSDIDLFNQQTQHMILDLCDYTCRSQARRW